MGVSSLESHDLTGFNEMFTVSFGALPKFQDIIPPQPPYYPAQILQAQITSQNGNHWD